MNNTNIIKITKINTNTKRYLVEFPNGINCRFSTHKQAVKFAKESNSTGAKISDFITKEN